MALFFARFDVTVSGSSFAISWSELSNCSTVPTGGGFDGIAADVPDLYRIRTFADAESPTNLRYKIFVAGPGGGYGEAIAESFAPPWGKALEAFSLSVSGILSVVVQTALGEGGAVYGTINGESVVDGPGGGWKVG